MTYRPRSVRGPGLGTRAETLRSIGPPILRCRHVVRGSPGVLRPFAVSRRQAAIGDARNGVGGPCSSHPSRGWACCWPDAGGSVVSRIQCAALPGSGLVHCPASGRLHDRGGPGRRRVPGASAIRVRAGACGFLLKVDLRPLQPRLRPRSAPTANKTLPGFRGSDLARAILSTPRRIRDCTQRPDPRSSCPRSSSRLSRNTRSRSPVSRAKAAR